MKYIKGFEYCAKINLCKIIFSCTCMKLRNLMGISKSRIFMPQRWTNSFILYLKISIICFWLKNKLDIIIFLNIEMYIAYKVYIPDKYIFSVDIFQRKVYNKWVHIKDWNVKTMMGKILMTKASNPLPKPHNWCHSFTDMLVKIFC